MKLSPARRGSAQKGGCSLSEEREQPPLSRAAQPALPSPLRCAQKAKKEGCAFAQPPSYAGLAAAAVIAATAIVAAAAVAAAAAPAATEQDENDDDPETAVIISTEHGEYPFPVPYLRPGRARRSGRSVTSFRSSAGAFRPVCGILCPCAAGGYNSKESIYV